MLISFCQREREREREREMNLFLRTILYQGQHLGHGYHNRGHDGQLEGDWAILKDIIWLLLSVGF